MKTTSLILIIALITGVAGYLYKEHAEDAVSCDAIAELSRFDRPEACFSTFTRSDRVNAQIKSITSSECIRSAIKLYKLDDLFHIDSDALATEIADNLTVEQVDETMNIKIRVTSDSKEKSDQIAYAILHSYTIYNKELFIQSEENWIKKLNSKISEQKLIVGDHTKRLQELCRRLDVPFNGTIPPQEYPEGTHILTFGGPTQFEEVKMEYNKEVSNLETLQNALPHEDFKDKLKPTPLIIHKTNWIDETAKFMEARNQVE